jgi:pyridoxamine 5'-phosphate oxidase
MRGTTCDGPSTGETYEFWQHRDDRMHDRLRYRRSNGDWVVERLSP